jgi:hypothetical protein
VKCQPDCTCNRHKFKGVKRDPEVGRRISAAKMGHGVSEETRRKIGEAGRGRRSTPRAVEARRQATTVHGKHRTPTYRSWDGMKQRCLNPRATGYKRYGGSGVTVCDQWLTFAGFLADMGERPEGTTLDRIDPARGYEPGNCRWATASEQNRNRPNFNPDKRPGRE